MSDLMNGRLRVSWTLAGQVLAWLMAGLVAYAAMTTRVSVLESQQGDLDRRLQRIEDKLDRLLVR